MKNLNLAVLILSLSSCDARWDWYMDNYMSARVVNNSQQNVAMMFCSDKPRVVSEVMAVPSDQNVYQSDTFVKTIIERRMDRPQGDSFRKVQNCFAFALLAVSDQALSKLCINSEATLNASLGDNQDFPDRKACNYLVINKVDSCPENFKDYDQSQSPCQANF